MNKLFKMNESLTWQCSFDTNPSPIVNPICVKLPTYKTRVHTRVVVFIKTIELGKVSLLLVMTEISIDRRIMLQM